MNAQIYPVACPICGESQNALPGVFDPHSEPFGPVTCMVCNHQFSKSDYLTGLAAKAIAYAALKGPEEK